MCVCMHACYMCMYVYIRICIFVYIYVCICRYVCVCICVCVYVYVYLYMSRCYRYMDHLYDTRTQTKYVDKCSMCNVNLYAMYMSGIVK